MLEKNDKIKDYTLLRFLGKGQFGEVWLAEKRLEFATRTFRHALKFLSNIDNEIDLKSAEAEIDTWIEASGHPNVMSVLDMFSHDKHIVIVSEFADGGSLKRWLGKNGGKAPTEEQAVRMMLGILNGIEHLHSRNVIHRDLKPDNILLQEIFPALLISASRESSRQIRCLRTPSAARHTCRRNRLTASNLRKRISGRLA